MAKKEKISSRRRSIFFIIPLLISAVAWWVWHNDRWANWKDQIVQYVDNRDIITLEAHFLPEQIIETHRQELLGKDKRTLQNTFLKYYPYLLLNVKYLDNHKTREGMLLWGLNDGEIVLNTESWETTHGFYDCLQCQAARSDFRILQALAKYHGSLSMEDLQTELHVEREILTAWVEGAKRKHLILQKGNVLQLHFENPKLLITPQTKIKQSLVSKPLGEGKKIARTYSHHQITTATQAAFGTDFTIRNEQEVFLPVYSLEVLNPDGSIQVSEWNAVTGQRLKFPLI